MEMAVLAGNCWKWLDMAGMAENYWKWLEIARNYQDWLEWLNMAMFSYFQKKNSFNDFKGLDISTLCVISYLKI